MIAGKKEEKKKLNEENSEQEDVIKKGEDQEVKYSCGKVQCSVCKKYKE